LRDSKIAAAPDGLSISKQERRPFARQGLRKGPANRALLL